MNPFFTWIFLFLISFNTFAASSRVRRVPVLPGQIVTVKTALGIATIIQVPSPAQGHTHNPADPCQFVVTM